tara:strand:+ start:293 stop:532 length:240 start_codon:yes stop_codon:yes gene_type:complete
MAWKAEVQTQGNGEDWDGNALVFATEDEAVGYAEDLMSRWTAVKEYRVVECQDEATYRYSEIGAHRLPVAHPKHGEFNG